MKTVAQRVSTVYTAMNMLMVCKAAEKLHPRLRGAAKRPPMFTGVASLMVTRRARTLGYLPKLQLSRRVKVMDLVASSSRVWLLTNYVMGLKLPLLLSIPVWLLGLVATSVIFSLIECFATWTRGVVDAWRSERSVLTGSNSTPLLGQRMLLLILPPDISDGIVGDLEERFPRIQEVHGVRFARCWYWRHAVGAMVRYVGAWVLGTVSLARILTAVRRWLSV